MAITIASLYQKYVNRKVLITAIERPIRQGEVRGDDDVSIQVPGVVRDCRIDWGRRRLLIEPLIGYGAVWMEIGPKVKVVDEWPDEILRQLYANGKDVADRSSNFGVEELSDG